MRKWINLFEGPAPYTFRDMAVAIDYCVENEANDSLRMYLPDGCRSDEDLREFITDTLDNALGELEYRISNDELEVFRRIVAPADWDYRKETRPHKFWAFEKGAADVHWGDGKGTVWLLHGNTPVSNIDWPKTLRVLANPAYAEEKEVRLRDPNRVTILSAVAERNLGPGTAI
jgi:hypothetical protein